MSGFLRFDGPDPYELFGSQIRRSRLAMETAYDAAFEAWDRRHDLLKEHDWSSGYGGISVPWLDDAYGVETVTLTPVDLDRMRDEAVAQNVLADCQASIVLLVADDMLQRFMKGVLGPERRPQGYGPVYGVEYRGTAKLTVLLRAATNCIRHVSEWDALPWQSYRPWPSGTGGIYPTLDDCKAFVRDVDMRADAGQKPSRRERETVNGMLAAMQSIDVFQRIFGIGVHEWIRDPVSVRVITQVDGRLGQGISYDRFEDAVLSAGREIAAQRGAEAIDRFERSLS